MNMHYSMLNQQDMTSLAICACGILYCMWSKTKQRQTKNNNTKCKEDAVSEQEKETFGMLTVFLE